MSPGVALKGNEAQEPQEGHSLSAPTLVQRMSKSNLSSTSSVSALSPQLPTSSVFTPPIHITDTVTPSPCKSSASRKSKRKFPDFRWNISDHNILYPYHILWFKSVILLVVLQIPLIIITNFYFLSGLRKSLGKRRSEKQRKRSINNRWD